LFSQKLKPVFNHIIVETVRFAIKTQYDRGGTPYALQKNPPPSSVFGSRSNKISVVLLLLEVADDVEVDPLKYGGITSSRNLNVEYPVRDHDEFVDVQRVGIEVIDLGWSW
jgi:hypothetical protein